jgi:phosphate transport system protein
MKEYKRKLQIVAGSTYSLSLPKEWVRKFNLEPKQELMLGEQQDGNLLVSPRDLKMVSEKIIVSIDEYVEDLNQIILSLYYYGYNVIDFVSSREISNDVRNKIRKVLVNLSGAEIIFEDKKTISVKILFDEDRLNIFQIFYRINLIIGASIDNLINKFDWEEIKMNEDEVDRLYHFSMKIIQSSLTDRSILVSSKINNLKIIPSLFLISKKLENIADSIKKVARLVEKDSLKLKDSFEILPLIQEEINRSTLYLMGKQKKRFSKLISLEKDKIKEKIELIKSSPEKIYIERILRDLLDVQDEVVSIGFYNKLSSN